MHQKTSRNRDYDPASVRRGQLRPTYAHLLLRIRESLAAQV